MLNYIWLALLVLGIGAALSTDIVDQVSNKYKNKHQIPATIIFQNTPDNSRDWTQDVKIKITAESFYKIYQIKLEKDFEFVSKLSFSKKDNKLSLFTITDDSFPAIWKEIASVSGKETDLTGYVNLSTHPFEIESKAFITLETASFIKFKEVTLAALDYAATAVNIALGLIGIMALWLGVMKVAQEAGLITSLAKFLRPVTKKLFPDVPADHPAVGSMIMNISANVLGLGNAATPFGLKAMEELNTLNPEKETASNSMITFLAINTAGLTLIPATAIALRAAAGSSDPALIIGTSIFGASCAAIAGVTAAKTLEKFPIQRSEFTKWLSSNAKIFLTIGFVAIIIAAFFLTGINKMLSPVLGFLSPELFKNIIQIISILAIPVLIIFFIGYGSIKKVKVYEQFVEGAKEGFNIAVRIIPYLVAMLMAIGIFRAGGAMDWLIFILKPFTDFIGMPAEALPMALMRPLSGSGSLGIMAEIMKVHGPDSFIGIMVSTFYGSTETTFYVLAVYFGSVNIKNTRHAVPVGLIADVAGILGAVFIVKLLYGG